MSLPAARREALERDPHGGEGHEGVHELAHVPGPEGTKVELAATERLEVGGNARNLVGVTADDEDKLPVARADGAARQGCLDEVASPCGKTSADRAHGGGGVGGEVDQQGADGRPAQPFLRHGGHHLGRRQREERDVGVRRHVLGRFAGMRPSLDLGGEPSRVGVECGDRMAVRHQVGAHAAPDVAEADEPDPCFFSVCGIPHGHSVRHGSPDFPWCW